jgi:hypothetical protein
MTVEEAVWTLRRSIDLKTPKYRDQDYAIHMPREMWDRLINEARASMKFFDLGTSEQSEPRYLGYPVFFNRHMEPNTFALVKRHD